MDRSRLEPVAEVSVGAWIAPRLGPFGGWVGSAAPRGYAAYARVLHPVSHGHDADQRSIRWAEVCAATGRQSHALMQWHAIAGVVETRTRRAVTRTMAWPGGEPDVGNLERDTLLALCRVLTSHTAPDQDCFLALWEGFGWIHGSPAVAMMGSSTPIPPAFPPEVLNGPDLLPVWPGGAASARRGAGAGVGV